MGFFSRNRRNKSHSDQPRPSHSFADPPNLYHGNTTNVLPASHQTAPYSHQHVNQSQPNFHSAGQSPPYGWHQQQSYQPVIVNQHYYLNAPGQQQQQQQQQQRPAPQQLRPHRNDPYPHPRQHGSSLGLTRFATSMVNLAKDVDHRDEGRSSGNSRNNQLVKSSSSTYDDVFKSFNDVMTSIDLERFVGNEKSLFTCDAFQPVAQYTTIPPPGATPPHTTERALYKPPKKTSKDKRKYKVEGPQPHSVAASVVTGDYFSKVDLYANSKLPMNLPPLALYIPTWPLLCLAAQYSQRVYDSPKGAERDAHVSGDFFSSTKAMYIKSVPMDHMDTIVFAIRGTATFMDWAVNLKTEPTSPTGFLDDPGNLCHAGFLSVARKMVKPVASRLRQLLQEDPGRSRYSLMITGHSAGGAVAALLYSHMLASSKDARTELNLLAGSFKRIHCVTFGTPPVSLLPLQKPNRSSLRKSLFLSFVNEGDPVVRADKAYVKSLLELLASPPPRTKRPEPRDKKSSSPSHSKKSSTKPTKNDSTKPIWSVPPATLSNAGRIIVLRSGDPHAKPKDRKTVRERLDEGVLAVTCREDQLRGVVWGDPVCHLMNLYAGRIEVLAVGAVTAKKRR